MPPTNKPDKLGKARMPGRKNLGTVKSSKPRRPRKMSISDMAKAPSAPNKGTSSVLSKSSTAYGSGPGFGYYPAP